jgi:hypothetical protein
MKRKRSNATNNNILAIDINLDELVNPTAYNRFPLHLQTIQYAVRSATDDIFQHQVHP